MPKQSRYSALVHARKAFDPTRWSLTNPSAVDEGKLDSSHVGPWTIWAHDLNADLMVVGQDWGDVEYFCKNGGVDKLGNPTNDALRQLLASIGRPLPELPVTPHADRPESAECRVWLTNALLWLKTGGLSAAVERNWFDEPAIPFLREQISIVQPRVIVALGQRAYTCISAAYQLPRTVGTYRAIVERSVGELLDIDGARSTLIGVYHCGARIRNTVRPMDRQFADWGRVGEALVTA
jgi:hypothetical protein